jgi:hypothetical protein
MFRAVLITFFFVPFVTGCGLLLGSVKPVEEKSDNYRVLDLNRQDPDWNKLSNGERDLGTGSENAPVTKDQNQNSSADLAYQSKRTSSIVSLNSACRESREDAKPEELEEFSKLLFLGMTDIVHREERAARVADLPALETTVEGRLNGEPMKLKAIVLRKEDCIYDLMYVARPDRFPEHVEDFTRFVSSLKLK